MPKAASIHITGLRALTREDMTSLLAPVKKDFVISPDRIRDSHHRVARLSASGLNNTEIAERTGYTRSRISVILGSPAMKDLVAKYRDMVTAEWARAVKEDFDLGREAWRKAQRLRLDVLEAAECGEIDIPLRELSAIASDGEDRYGTTKKSTNINLNTDFAADLEAAVARSAKATPNIIEIEASPNGIRRRF